MDLEMNDVGILQAQSAANKLADWEISASYSSPLKRALRTAEIIATPHRLRVQRSDELIDINFGEWQGLSPQEVEAGYSNLYQLWLSEPHRVTFPRGESLQDVRQRIESLVGKVLVEHQEESIILVSHQVVCKVFLCFVLGLDNSHFWQVDQDICAINVFETRGNILTITLANDTCHLKEMTS